MKRVGYLYEKVWDLDNCKAAIRNAIRNKSSKTKKRHNLKQYLENIDFYAQELSNMLRYKTFRPSPYGKFLLKDGLSKKERTISTTRFFPDQCVYWALLNVAGPILRRGTYAYSCAGIKGRGTLFASKRIRSWFDGDPKQTKYCLKIDIKHFYPSIDNEILKRFIRRLIKDSDVLNLFDSIIDLERGIPIGTVLSPYFADVMLQSLDYLIKQKLNGLCRYYIRYADDMCIFSNNKKNLRKVLEEIKTHLAGINLKLKENYQIFLVERIESRGKNKGKRHGRRVDFCGYAVSHVNARVRKGIALRIIRTCRKLAAGRYTVKMCRRFMSYNGWLKHSCTTEFKRKYIYGKIKIKRVKEVISNESKICHLKRIAAAVPC